MLTNNLGYPRIGSNRELKKACEKYWAGKLSVEELAAAGKNIRLENWKAQQQAGIDLIPVNDFSFYDQVLDLTLALGAIPERYQALPRNGAGDELDLYFAMARGYQKNGLDITALEMTKWFDTNYHYLVPEFHGNQTFQLLSNKVVQEYSEAIAAGIAAKPVLLGPVSYLLLGKEKEAGFHRIDLLPRLLPVYIRLLQQLAQLGATWVQLDEPCLALDLTAKEQEAFETAYRQIAQACPELSLLLANYFDCYGVNLKTALSLPVQALHLDLVRCPSQLEDVLQGGRLSPKTSLSLGVVDGRNIWKNDFNQSLSLIQ
jgi:5-methyltetrahydropteroyltriglutamate--homocysteine methyltransferase